MIYAQKHVVHRNLVDSRSMIVLRIVKVQYKVYKAYKANKAYKAYKCVVTSPIIWLFYEGIWPQKGSILELCCSYISDREHQTYRIIISKTHFNCLVDRKSERIKNHDVNLLMNSLWNNDVDIEEDEPGKAAGLSRWLI